MVSVYEIVRQSIRLLLDFCGRVFDPACLKFYENKRVVTTSSYHQVRRPIYRSAVNRSKAYSRHLRPLICELAGLESFEA